MNEQEEGAIPYRRSAFSVVWAILLATVLVGVAARFYGLGSVPPGLYHDEAFNGIDALRILAGERPVFFEANNGREPLFLYGMAVVVAVLGRTPVAVRLTAAILGTLLVPATFLMARALFNDRVGLWSAWLIAVAPWTINLSRIGLRAISMPLVLATAVWLWWTGTQKTGRRRWVRLSLGGVFFGLSLYTYTAARFAVIVAMVYALYQLWMGYARPHRSERSVRIGIAQSLVVPALVALVVAFPLLRYGLTHWEMFITRPGQVSVFSAEINDGDLWGALIHNVVSAVGLFFYRGDFIPRHNVPFRPLFDPLVSVFGLLGVVWCVGKRGSACVLALVWTAVMLLPTILAEDCPHFLRAVGVLPVAALFPALGLEWARQRLIGRDLGWVGNLGVGIVLVVAAVWGGYDYFVRHGRNPDLAYDFEAAQMQEAVEINRFLGTGWQGQGIVEPTTEPAAGRHVYLHPRMWEDRLTTNFLVGSPAQVSIVGRSQPVDADQVLVLGWPHEDLSYVKSLLPHPAAITSWPGPLERGDLESEAKLLYVAFSAAKLPTASRESDIVARFDQGIELIEWDVEPQGSGETRLALRWRARIPIVTDYTVFVHVIRNGRTVAQDDGFPGNGFLPTTWWQPGDEILDVHTLSAPYDQDQDHIVVGWYEWRSMQHLEVLDEHLQPVGTSLELR